MTDIDRYVIDQSRLPTDYPTHAQPGDFWEALGRAVGTFGFLEEVLCKAIFALTATRPYNDAEIVSAYEEWVVKLERSLSDPLGNLIDTYGKAVREHPEATISNRDDLLRDLRAASKIRNVLCHGSWRTPDSSGASIPFYVNKQGERFDTPIDKRWLEVARQHILELICAVINSVTHMGFQFPSSSGPGTPVWESNDR
ncbi:hypothetical protein BK673_24520 [Pseudomonas fluorescens]|uniref:RiboL-PSP-HEPN domain-containing protein n=1 Tax=Pseudomonas fluorescens TaxID=294 RepID=A0A423P019_PSEFL|nr:hypothetical protein [Pseudomonas fluorescens]ROO03846.1 hypothetical protein BK673_24520 [Pseudomonas fluorescens]